MNIDRAPTAATQRGEWAAELIRQSPIPSPKVRRDALRESCRVVQTEDDLKDLFIDCICGSPYFGETQKQELAHAILLGNWKKLARLVGVNHVDLPPSTTTQSQLVWDFKCMAVSIFRTSRKICQLSVARRQQLEGALLACHSREGLTELLLQSLQYAQTLSEHSRILIANDVLEGNFHRLLLEDRFDCDEVPRLDSMPIPSAPLHEEPEDCIICFGSFQDGQSCTLSSCGHSFCQGCIQEWARIHDSSQFPCPVCRGDSTLPVEPIRRPTRWWRLWATGNRFHWFIKTETRTTCASSEASLVTWYAYLVSMHDNGTWNLMLSTYCPMHMETIYSYAYIGP